MVNCISGQVRECRTRMGRYPSTTAMTILLLLHIVITELNDNFGLVAESYNHAVKLLKVAKVRKCIAST